MTASELLVHWAVTTGDLLLVVGGWLSAGDVDSIICLLILQL